METFWYIALTFMLIMYVILDGFDLGAGIIHFWAGKDEHERRIILNAIGPYWDGNEVWLVAAGGTLYFAFPKLYASSFSGFYLPLILVLWVLILRALGIEFRHHLRHPMWKMFWDRTFSVGSLLLVIFLGAALGNIIRGVPLNEEGYFFVPLWTNFSPGEQPGVLDWFTLLFVAVAVSTLMVHGAHFLAFKTAGKLQQRAARIAGRAWWAMTASSVLALVAVYYVRPDFWPNLGERPAGLFFLILSIAAWWAMAFFNRKGEHFRAFLSSSAFIAGMGATTAWAHYPIMLYATTDPGRHLTIYNAASSAYGLKIGLMWWIPGMLLACGYFAFLFYVFRGKITSVPEDSGY